MLKHLDAKLLKKIKKKLVVLPVEEQS